MTEIAFDTGLTVSHDAPQPATAATEGAKDKATAAAGSAQEQAGQLASTAKDQAAEVVGTAKEQAANVLGDASEQARSLLAEAQTELTSQASTQKERAVTGLRALSVDLTAMAENAQASGVAAHVVAEAGRRSETLATFLEEREPGALVEELRGLGRRRTGAFLLGAVVLGFAGGRLLKGAQAGNDSPAEPAKSPASLPPVTPVGELPPATAVETPASPIAEYGSLARTPHLLPDDDV